MLASEWQSLPRHSFSEMREGCFYLALSRGIAQDAALPPSNHFMLKKNWYFFVPVVLIAIPALVVAFYMFGYGYAFDDAWKATKHFGSSSTRYAVKYDAERFNRITQGIDGRQVFELVGVPFEGQGGLEWKYALPGGDTPYYHERLVIFERDKNEVPRVKRLVKGFHTGEAAKK